MARSKRGSGKRIAVVMLAIGLAGGWWLAHQEMPDLIKKPSPGAHQAEGDIRRVDFRNFSYTPACLMADGEPSGASLTVHNGTYRSEQEDNPIQFGILSIQYGDLTGDGHDEAAVVTHCNLGGTGQFTEGMVYSMQAGKPLLISRVEGGDRAYGGIAGLSITDGRLIVERFETDDGPSCCPMYIDTTLMRWDGTQLKGEGAITRRAAPTEK